MNTVQHNHIAGRVSFDCADLLAVWLQAIFEITFRLLAQSWRTGRESPIKDVLELTGELLGASWRLLCIEVLYGPLVVFPLNGLHEAKDGAVRRASTPRVVKNDILGGSLPPCFEAGSNPGFSAVYPTCAKNVKIKNRTRKTVLSITVFLSKCARDVPRNKLLFPVFYYYLNTGVKQGGWG